MSREKRQDGMTPKGKRIVAALSELRDVLASGERVEDHFTVDQIKGSEVMPDPELVQSLAALRRERERQGLSLSEVATRTGMSKGDLSRLETGKVVNPTLVTLRTYARALGKRLIWSVAALDETPVGNRKVEKPRPSKPV